MSETVVGRLARAPDCRRIEAALAAHPAVRAAAVRVQAGPDGRPRVVAHLVPQDTAGEGAPELENGLMERWQTLWELLYAGPDGADPAFDVRGWMNSYTREPLPVAEMRDWVERTVDAIASLRPRRLLEIGVGSGLLLYRLAPSCEQYWAVDFCAGAVRRIAAEVAGRGLSDRVRLLHRRADDLDDLPRDFDCVVLNSVVQYFPTTDYLFRVIAAAVDRVVPGGAVFVGDVYSLPLAPAFHASVVLDRAEPDTDRETLLARTRQRTAAQSELVLAPRVLAEMATRHPRVVGLSVRPKRGAHTNEMTSFRYDAVLNVGDAAPAPPPVQVRWHDWRADGLDLTALRGLLGGPGEAAIGVTGIANARTAAAVHAYRAMADPAGPPTAREISAAAGASTALAVTTDELAACTGNGAYRPRLSWLSGRPDGSVDAVWTRRDLAEGIGVPVPDGDGSGPLANEPLGSRRTDRLTLDVAAFLRERLPGSVLPDLFLCVPHLPDGAEEVGP